MAGGVDVSVIRDYLGHASIATTSRYLTTNLQMKREALDLFWKRSGLAPSQPPHKLLRACPFEMIGKIEVDGIKPGDRRGACDKVKRRHPILARPIGGGV